MPIGPVQILVVKFPGSQFRGDIVPALTNLVERDLVRIIDIAFASRDQDGILTVIEMGQLQGAEFDLFDALVADVSGMISEEDILSLGNELEAGSSAAILLYEMTWAKGFADALRAANAEVLLHDGIPHELIELAAEAAEEWHGALAE